MEIPVKSTSISKKEISFSNGNRAACLLPSPAADPADIVAELNVPAPQAVLLLAGGADGMSESLRPRLARFFGLCLAPAAADTGALLIDGGTQSGAMEMAGAGVADYGHKSVLLGVAPRGKVLGKTAGGAEGREKVMPLDPNHSHFVLPEADDWGGETATMLELAAAFRVPVLTILVNGGPNAESEVLRCVRNGWPVIVVEGSERFADELAELWKTRPAEIPSAARAEILARGDLRLFPVSGSAGELERLILAQSCHRPLLERAWQLFATYDLNAGLLQKRFRRLQNGILWLGVAAVALALAQTEAASFLAGHPGEPHPVLGLIATGLKPVLVILPVGITLLLAAANRFRPGVRWILLRSTAEALKREIYGYRVRAGSYGAQQLGALSPEDRLQSQIETITRRLMQTEVNRGSLLEYKGQRPPAMYGAAAQDGGFDLLSPERYLQTRVGDQEEFYRSKSRQLDRQSKCLQVFLLAAGGLGTLLAAFGRQLWMALTTAVATAVTAFLAQRQVEQNLIQYNQTATDLANIQNWWLKLTPAERRSRTNIDLLVVLTEKVLEGQMSGWVQRMEDILAELRDPQSRKPASTEPPPEDEKPST